MTEYFKPVDGEIQSIELLRYEPGDVLVVRPTFPITAEHADRLRRYTETYLPGIKCLVVDQDYELQLYRPTTEGDQA